MSTEQNKAVLARVVAAINERNLEKLDELADEVFTDDYVLHHPPDFTDLRFGPEGFKQLMRRILANMPDLHLTEDDVFAEEDKVATRWTGRGTDLSQQKRVTLTILIISQFVDGKISEEWELVHPVEG
jgi:predicted ester cyclase